MPPFTPDNILSLGASDPAGIEPFFQRYRSSDSCVWRNIFLCDKHPAFSGVRPMTGFHHGRFSGAYTAPDLCSGFSPDSLNPAPSFIGGLRRRITTQHIRYVTIHPKINRLQTYSAGFSASSLFSVFSFAGDGVTSAGASVGSGAGVASTTVTTVSGVGVSSAVVSVGSGVSIAST